MSIDLRQSRFRHLIDAASRGRYATDASIYQIMPLGVFVPTCDDEAAALVRRFKGACSGEHGDGLCRGEWIRRQFGPAVDGAFRTIKRHLDPAGPLNPGKIVDAPRMDDASLVR